VTDYQRIEKAIYYIKENFQQQPELEDVAKSVYLSPYHFQRVFKEWAGVSPKKFLQYISVEHAKNLLKQNLSVSDATYETGLSSPGRLHDLFITIEGMTPGEYKNGGENLHINFSYAETPFGDVIIASTPKGICHIAFIQDETDDRNNLQQFFPNATLNQKTDLLQQNALKVFTDDWSNLSQIKLHLKATPFQIKVWQALLRIPFGGVRTYANLAKNIQLPNASRAIGTACGSNPVAYLIPCHRVIKSTGLIGEYHWGSTRKTAILGWEAAHVFGE
jgi:AraC family transcriptional regulator, regulatory protein of adaptative response / methylated-DNA-[protein]-cysteine methyltransferase